MKMHTDTTQPSTIDNNQQAAEKMRISAITMTINQKNNISNSFNHHVS